MPRNSHKKGSASATKHATRLVESRQLISARAYKIQCHWNQLGVRIRFVIFLWLGFRVRVSFKANLLGVYFIHLHSVDGATESS